MTAAASARQILTGLHEVMAGRTHAQAKLDAVVEIIGESLDSEVCSIYLLREGMLELFATRGLEQSAVHVTRLAIGEGLNGIIADHIGDNQPEHGGGKGSVGEIPPAEAREVLAQHVDFVDVRTASEEQ